MNKTKIYKILAIVLAFIVLSESIWIIRWTRNNEIVKDDSDQSVERELSYTFKKALSEGKIEVWFQPIVDPDSEKVNGAEALSRWKDEDGYISPSVFVAVLEKSGQIKDLDKYAFSMACDFQKERLNEGHELFPISVNLSIASINEDTVTEYKEIYDSYGLSEKLVNIEITQSIEGDTEKLKQIVEDFHKAGFLVEIDDFGSGYNSISDLAEIPYDILKIDKSLIDGIKTEKGNILVNDTVKIGKDLGMAIIAEGVEDAKQAEYLRDLGCNGIQGYYYSKALNKDDFIDYLSKQ